MERVLICAADRGLPQVGAGHVEPFAADHDRAVAGCFNGQKPDPWHNDQTRADDTGHCRIVCTPNGSGRRTARCDVGRIRWPVSIRMGIWRIWID